MNFTEQTYGQKFEIRNSIGWNNKLQIFDIVLIEIFHGKWISTKTRILNLNFAA